MSSSESLLAAAAALVRQVHGADTRVALAITGGGSLAIPALLTIPGGSRTVLEAIVPYSSTSLSSYLRGVPEQFCSQHTARLMAMAAYERARNFVGREGTHGDIAGIGCTASLVSDRPKQGAHRIYLAAQTAQLTAVASLELAKGARDRAQEEDLAARLVLNMIAQACGLPDRLPLELLTHETVVEDAAIAPPAWQALFAGEINVALCRVPGGHHESRAIGPAAIGRDEPAAETVIPRQDRAVFPGAFHPLHDGHREMARLAAVQLGMPIEWELSITNVDKPPLDFYEMRLRAAQFPSGATLWLTRAPTFVEKAATFPAATFIVGADTIARIAEPRYYGADRAACQRALAAIAAAGCRFLVFGRRTHERFESLAELELPAILRGLCDEVPQNAFQVDVSSTELRRAEAVDE